MRFVMHMTKSRPPTMSTEPTADPAPTRKATAQKRRVAANKFLTRSAAGIWYFRRTHWDPAQGKRVIESFSLDTRDEKLARARRDAHLRESHGKELDALRGRRRTDADAAATVGEAINLYLSHAREILDKTRDRNAHALLNVCRRAFRTDTAGARKVALSALDAAAVRRFQSSMRADKAPGDFAAQARAATSANSLLTQARSVFAQPAVFRDDNGRARLTLPDLSAFLKADKLKGETDTAFRPLTEDEGAKLLAALDALRASNPRLHLAALLMFRCGLRNEEAANVQPEWIERRRDGAAWCRIRRYAHFEPKGTLRDVPIPPEVLREIDALTPTTEAPADLYLTTPGMTARQRLDFVHRALPRWFATVLPTRSPYDLRKHAGSMVALAQGMHAAQKFLGHASITTTEKHYAGLLVELQPTRVAFLGSANPAPEETPDQKRARLLAELEAIDKPKTP